jgi:hypothetical protein
MMDERHFTCVELAKLWHLSKDMIRKLAAEESGVIRITREELPYARRMRKDGSVKAGKRVYRSIRIPESVAKRIHERLTRGASRLIRPPTRLELLRSGLDSAV